MYGGVPQGSILGVLLFNVSTDDLEDDPDDGREFLNSPSDCGDRMVSSRSTGSSDGPHGEDEDYDGVPLLESSTFSDREERSPDPRLNPLAAEFYPGERHCPPAELQSGKECDEVYSKELPLQWEDPPMSVSDGWPESSDYESFYSAVEDLLCSEQGATQPDKRSEDVREESTSPESAGEERAAESFAVSIPIAGARGRPRFRDSPMRCRGPPLMVRDWSYMPGRRNRRRRRNLKKSYSDEGEVMVPTEQNRKKTGLRWKSRPPLTLKFVDDGMLISKAKETAQLRTSTTCPLGFHFDSRPSVHAQIRCGCSGI